MRILVVMPRVTDAHRQARRDEIARAAVRVLHREGVANASIARIVEESGLSAGAIYANFENKSELARTVAATLLDWRMDLIEGDDPARERTPGEVIGDLLTSFEEEAPPARLVLQYWGESTTDPDLHAVLEATVSRLRSAFARAVLPWARRRSPDGADALAARTATTMVVLCQGYLANLGLLGWLQPHEYLAGIRDLFDEPAAPPR